MMLCRQREPGGTGSRIAGGVCLVFCVRTRDAGQPKLSSTAWRDCRLNSGRRICSVSTVDQTRPNTHTINPTSFHSQISICHLTDSGVFSFLSFSDVVCVRPTKSLLCGSGYICRAARRFVSATVCFVCFVPFGHTMWRSSCCIRGLQMCVCVFCGCASVTYGDTRCVFGTRTL